MTLLKNLIAIPERVHQGDFVLQLSKGVTEPEQTLRDYVVTPQLVDAFANALGFIQQAVQTGGSKAAYLHGSFGSGKSHFMAVLNLLLAGNTQARATPELADVVARQRRTHGLARGPCLGIDQRVHRAGIAIDADEVALAQLCQRAGIGRLGGDVDRGEDLARGA